MDMRALLENYEQNHESVACKATHAVGIPLIALSIPMLLVRPKRALAFFVAGWTLQFVGHAIEGKPPKFFEGKEYFLAGLVWWFRLVSAPARLLGRG
jgi:uncharacterized membrane protein YGL010W